MRKLLQSAATINAVCMSALEKSMLMFQSILSLRLAGHRSRCSAEVLDAYDTVALLVFTFLLL